MKAAGPEEAASNFMDLPGCRKAVIGGDQHLGSSVYVVPKKAPVWTKFDVFNGPRKPSTD